MAGHIERLRNPAGIYRDVPYGQRYDVTVTLEYLAPNEVIVHGLRVENFSREAYDAIASAMGADGIEFYNFVRYKRGKAVPHRHWIRALRKQNSRKGTAMDKRLHILGGGFTVVGVDGKFRNSFPGPNHFRVTEAEYVNIVQPEYISFLKSLLTLNDLPKPAADEGRVHLIQGDTYVVDDEGNLHTHIGGAKYLNLADSVFMGIEQKLIESQERLNAAAKAGLAASQVSTPAAA